MKAKYKRGRKIESVGDFEKSPVIFFRVLFGKDERTRHRGFLESWQYHTLETFIRRGWVYEAEPIEEAYKIVDHRYEVGGVWDGEPWAEKVWFSCGYCDETIIDMDEICDKYVDRCPHCGKKIDWDGWDK